LSARPPQAARGSRRPVGSVGGRLGGHAAFQHPSWGPVEDPHLTQRPDVAGPSSRVAGRDKNSF